MAKFDVTTERQRTLVGLFPNLPEPLKAWEVVKRVCGVRLNYDCELILFDDLDLKKQSRFCNADIVIVDCSVKEQCVNLFYTLSVRLCWKMTNNVLVMWDRDTNQTLNIKTIGTPKDYKFIPYTFNDSGQLLLSDDYGQNNVMFKKKVKHTISSLAPVKRVYLKSYLHQGLSKVSHGNDIKEVKKELERFKKLMKDNPEELYCTDVIYDLLISYRDIEDYKSMSKFVESLPEDEHRMHPKIQHLYAFALERRSKDDNHDRDKALKIISKLLENEENHIPEILSVCGRIYKSKYLTSGKTNQEHLDNAILWYKKGFDAQKNVLSGINLVTLLVLKGETISTSIHLHSLCMEIGSLLGKKGSLEELTDYWDLATSFELNVILKQHSYCNKAALCMFKLKPQAWKLKSTIRNIELIESHRPKTEAVENEDKLIYQFWTDFFVDATIGDTSKKFRFKVLILEDVLLGGLVPTDEEGQRERQFVPSSIIVHCDDQDGGNTTIDIEHLTLGRVNSVDDKEQLDERLRVWRYPLERIVNISYENNKDDRQVVIYVNPDDFDLHFPSREMRNRFIELISPFIEQKQNVEEDRNDSIEYEYDLDAKGEKKCLGSGTYGKVYSAIDKLTKQKIAVKEIPINHEDNQVQLLVDEIALHRRLKHKNIVRYLDCEKEGSMLKIFMEQVPGGSLAFLVRKEWGPLKKNEPTMSYYTRQIIEGLQYLHEQRIVHRDIKSDNILIDMYKSTIKISDFGTSKRIQGMCQKMVSFKGTPQFMAPEVIRSGQRGYGPPADIWSLGCTVLEMCTGKVPFHELGTTNAAIYKIGKNYHPELPDDVSEELIEFLKSCFIPDQERRPNAAQLLESTFIEKHRYGKLPFTPNSPLPCRKHYLRSASVPPIQALQTSPDAHSYKQSMSMEVRKASTSTETSPNPGIIVSPADGGSLDPLLRHTKGKEKLLHIFKDNQTLICREWMTHLQAISMTNVWTITEEFLLQLLEYISQFVAAEGDVQTKYTLATIAKTTKNSLEQVQVAVEAFPDAIKNIIKEHSDEPHWMLVIQPMVKKAVFSVREALQPGERKLSRLTSMDTETPSDTAPRQSPSCASEENAMTLRRFTEIQEDFLRRFAEHQEEFLRSFIHTQTEVYEALNNEIEVLRAGKRSFSVATDEDIEKYCDQELVTWLQSNAFSNDAIKKIIREEFTMQDLKFNVTKEDLRDIGLRIGPRCRLWNCIERLRDNLSMNGCHG